MSAIQQIQQVLARMHTDMDKIVKIQLQLRDSIAQYQDLRANIASIKESGQDSLETLVNVGCEYYMEAEIPDVSRVFVDIGLGIFAEFTLDEAVRVCSERETLLTKKVDIQSAVSARIKAQMFELSSGLAQLKRMESASEP